MVKDFAGEFQNGIDRPQYPLFRWLKHISRWDKALLLKQCFGNKNLHQQIELLL